MNHFEPVALVKFCAFVLGARHDFFVALNRNQGVRQAQRSEQLLHGGALPDTPFFAVDYELHRP
jgi:hypothetical protein